MRAFVWLFRFAVFFTLFAFALNNQHASSIHWFFGQEWHAPMVFIVLAAFGVGCAFGVVAMVPSWWRHRRSARREAARVPATVVATPTSPGGETFLAHPPRDGL